MTCATRTRGCTFVANDALSVRFPSLLRRNCAKEINAEVVRLCTCVVSLLSLTTRSYACSPSMFFFSRFSRRRHEKIDDVAAHLARLCFLSPSPIASALSRFGIFPFRPASARMRANLPNNPNLLRKLKHTNLVDVYLVQRFQVFGAGHRTRPGGYIGTNKHRKYR